LAPGIHVGKQLSRGSIIGKVDKSLMFEVTKDNKHMNPLKLIRL
jgi:murein DD-endopeptidase MepM/ murein hydrolase activator NlpD